MLYQYAILQRAIMFFIFHKPHMLLLCCMYRHALWASDQIRNIAGCACTGNAGNVFPRRRLQRKRSVSDPGMHHGTCITHVPWCMSGSFATGGEEDGPGIPGACAPAIFRIWQEAYCDELYIMFFLSSITPTCCYCCSVCIIMLYCEEL